jgi:DNA polymerase II small subunit
VPDSQLVVDLAGRLSGKIIVSSDVTPGVLEGRDIEALSAKILRYFEDKEGMKVLDRETLRKILAVQGEEKAPIQIEISKPLNYKPLAKDLDAEYRIRNIDAEHTGSSVADFTSYFNDRFERLREFFGSSRGTSLGSMLNSIESVKQYTTGREVSIVGMIYDKIITKNGHLLVTLEDESGSAKVLFVKSSRENTRDMLDLFESAKRIITDEVIAIRGKISGGLIIANTILWPDIPIRTRKRTEEDTAIAFLSDIHVGSKLFMEKQFARFLSWINGDVDHRKDLAGKIKYIVASGDLVDGIGVYPNQDKELSIPDIYKQYSVLLDFTSAIPDYIHVFLLPGNHDAVRRAEPQPALGKDLIGEFNRSNIHFVSDPGYVTVGGIKVLGYHGTSLDSVIQAVHGCSYSKPEIAMTEVLKRRHLSPIYGDNPIVPSRKDTMVIDEVPDILHMGHVHKNGDSDYHGTLIVNSGTWQARTAYQVKLGHIPSPAVLPVYETKNMTLSTVDFNVI